MASVVGLTDLSIALIDAGNRLLTPPSSTEELLTLLNETESLLRDVGQAQPFSMQNALIPSKNALVSSQLLTHPDSDVRVSLVSCLTEIMRITAPQAPYSDDLMKEIFRLTVEAFEKLADASSRSYGKAEFVLDTVSRLSSCLVMLDLECDDLILQMFRIFLRIIRFDHPLVVPSSMEMIMITVLDETDEVSKDLLDTLLTSVKKENQNVSPMSWSLAEKVLSRCARKLQPYIMKALKSPGTSLDLYSPVVSSICQTIFETPKVHNAVNTKENEAAETKLAPRDSLEDKLGSKRPAREGTRRISGNDKIRKGNSWSLSKRSLKQVKSEGIDAETDLRITGKRGRKPNSLMNPEEGYDISWLSGKRDSSSNKKLGKVSAKKTRPALTGSLKRSRVSVKDTSEDDSDSLSSPSMKILSSREEEANQESYDVPEDDRKIKSSGKKKPIFVSSSGKRSSARKDTKKEASQVAAGSLAEESEEASKSHPARRRTARKEVKSYTDDFGEGLVGKRVNIWWPLDKTFYEGVIESYCSRKKMHLVLYTDGETEELNLIKERWELLEDLTSDSEDMENDLPESTPLLDIMQKEIVKKSENTSSSAKRSSSRTFVKKGSGKGGSKAGVVKNLKSLNAETDRSEEQEVTEDEDSQSEDEYYNSEKHEPSKNKSEGSLKLAGIEAEGKDEEEEKQGANSEAESEREGSESAEEPKWRDTDDTEDEAEEVDDDKVKSTSLRETEKDADEDRES